MSSYKALYRKYRPQTFNEVVGQTNVVKTLKNEIRLNHIFHAYIFTGPRGTGKTSIARIFAKAINCESPINGDSCNSCEICNSIQDATNPDIIEIDAASQTRVDNIREIIDKVPYLPTMSKYKVYIIDEVHMLSTSAFNALLKTLEEPPKHVVFILCTTEVEKLLPTIISRCQKFDFHLIDEEGIKNRLKEVVSQENILIEDEAIELISENATGGMRDALSILDQVSSIKIDEEITKDDVLEVTGKLSVDSLNNIAKAINENDATSAISFMEGLMKIGKEAEKITTSLITYFKDILVLKNTSKSINKVGYNLPEFKTIKESFSNQKLYSLIDILSDSLKNIKASLDKKMYLELAFIKMCDFEVKEITKPINKETENKPTSINNDSYNPNIVYGTPSFIKEEPKVQQQESLFNGFEKESIMPEQPKENKSSFFDQLISQKTEEQKENELIEDNNTESPYIGYQEEPIIEPIKEKEVELEEEVIVESKEESVEKIKEVLNNNIEEDYSLSFIEETLLKASKDFKTQVNNNLPNAIKETRGTSYQKYASLLDGGNIVASSQEKFIITFNEVGHCNLVMKKENYNGIKSIFKDYMDLNLDFVAIPTDLWDGLSKDYLTQYNANKDKTKCKLKKIPYPTLKAIIKEEEIVKDEYDELELLFGDKLSFKK